MCSNDLLLKLIFCSNFVQCNCFWSCNFMSITTFQTYWLWFTILNIYQENCNMFIFHLIFQIMHLILSYNNFIILKIKDFFFNSLQFLIFIKKKYMVKILVSLILANNTTQGLLLKYILFFYKSMSYILFVGFF